MLPISVSITPPYKHHGPASPEFLAKQREQVLALNSTTDLDLTSSKEVPKSRSAELIERGADPQEALGLEPEAPVGEKPGFAAAGPGELQEEITRSIAAEAIFAAALEGSADVDASRDLQLQKAKQEDFITHKQALEGYAKAALAFQETLSGRDSGYDLSLMA